MPPRPKKRKPGGGRKPDGAAARNVPVTIKLSEAEHAAISGAVERENAEALADPTANANDKRPATVSSWIRDHALDPLGLATFEPD